MKHKVIRSGRNFQVVTTEGASPYQIDIFATDGDTSGQEYFDRNFTPKKPSGKLDFPD
jgi:hypothetical protein